MRGKPPVALSDEQRAQALASIRRFFREELDEELGDLKAGFVLDYVLAEIGTGAYNRGVADAAAFFSERVADLGALAYQDEFQYWKARRARPEGDR